MSGCYRRGIQSETKNVNLKTHTLVSTIYQPLESLGPTWLWEHQVVPTVKYSIGFLGWTD